MRVAQNLPQQIKNNRTAHKASHLWDNSISKAHMIDMNIHGCFQGRQIPKFKILNELLGL